MVPHQPWARSHQQHGPAAAFGHGCGAAEDAALSIIRGALVAGGGDEDHWKHHPSFHWTPGFAHYCLLPASSPGQQDALGQTINTSTKPDAEPAPQQVRSASALDFFAQRKLEGKKAIPETKLGWKMLFIPLNSLQRTQ